MKEKLVKPLNMLLFLEKPLPTNLEPKKISNTELLKMVLPLKSKKLKLKNSKPLFSRPKTALMEETDKMLKKLSIPFSKLPKKMPK
jgi:hypothetical protein